MKVTLVSHKHQLNASEENTDPHPKRRETELGRSRIHEREENETAANLNKRSPKILVAEDSGTSRLLLGKILSNGGYTDYMLAKDGMEAQNLIEQADVPFDIVFTDHEMPYVTGKALAKKIRNIWKETIIISISSNGDWWFQARPDLFNGALPKPFRKQSVLDTLKKFFP